MRFGVEDKHGRTHMTSQFNAQTMADLPQHWIASVANTAATNFNTSGGLTPVALILACGKKSAMYVVDLSTALKDTEDKDALSLALGHLLKELGATAYVIAAEAWLAMPLPEETGAAYEHTIPPSERSDRKEILLLCCGEAGKPHFIEVTDVDRDVQTGKPFLLEASKRKSYPHEGRFAYNLAAGNTVEHSTH